MPSRQLEWNANLTRHLKELGPARASDALVPHNYLLNAKVLHAFHAEHWAGVTMAFGAATTAHAVRESGGRRLWITEYNLSPPTAVPLHEPSMVPSAAWLKNASFSLAHAGHILGHILAGIESAGTVQMMHLHSLFGNPATGRAFVKLHDGSMSVSSVAQIFAHVAALAKFHTEMAALDTSTAGMLSFNITDEPLRRIQAVAFSTRKQLNGSTIALVLINRDVEDVQVQIEVPVYGGGYRHVAYHEPDPGQSLPWHEIQLDGSQAPSSFPWPGPVHTSIASLPSHDVATVVLPKLSISVVEPNIL